jgi:hypothetical protein
MFTSLHLSAQDGFLLGAGGVLFGSYLRRAGRPRAAFAALALSAPALWFASELVYGAVLVRVPVLLALILLPWMARELRLSGAREATGSGGEDPRRSPTRLG